MRKTIITIAAAIALATGVQAQSVDEGVKMYKYERYQSAERILTPLAAGNAMANYYLGLAQLGQEKYDAAKATFGKFPDDAANMAGMARVAFEQKNATQGLQLAQGVAGKAKKKEWQPYQYAADAVTYTDGGTAQQAVDWYKKALENNNDNADVHIGLGDAYQKISGGGGEAMNNYEHVIEKDPKNSLAYSRIGALWYAARNYTSAVDNYSKAKDADPTNPLPYRDLANAYERVGKYELSLDNMKKYMDLSDKSVDDQIQNAEILYLAKHYQEAAAQAQQLIQQGVKKPSIYGLLGFAQYESHDSVNALNNARTYFTQQDKAKIKPLDYLKYGQIFMSNKMNDSANYYFGLALTADTVGDKSEIYRQIAEGFKDQKEYAKSAEWYTKLVTAYPASPAIDYFWGGAMYYYSKDYPNAGKLFEQMETKYADQPSATYWRGRVAAAIDAEGKDCSASPFFTKWLDKVGPNYDKKNDLKLAYEYLVLCNYNKKDKANEDIYKEKLRAIDATDNLLKQIEDAEKGGGAAAPKKTAAPAKGKK